MSHAARVQPTGQLPRPPLWETGGLGRGFRRLPASVSSGEAWGHQGLWVSLHLGQARASELALTGPWVGATCFPRNVHLAVAALRLGLQSEQGMGVWGEGEVSCVPSEPRAVAPFDLGAAPGAGLASTWDAPSVRRAGPGPSQGECVQGQPRPPDHEVTPGREAEK